MGQLDSVIESIGIKCVLVAIVIVYGVCRNYAINFAAWRTCFVDWSFDKSNTRFGSCSWNSVLAQYVFQLILSLFYKGQCCFPHDQPMSVCKWPWMDLNNPLITLDLQGSENIWNILVGNWVNQAFVKSRFFFFRKYQMQKKLIRFLKVIIPLLLSLCAVLFRFFSTETMDVEWSQIQSSLIKALHANLIQTSS